MDLRDLNLAELDKNLSEEERREWNSIYASYRAGSLLTGTVSGMETKTVDVKNEETGEYEEKIFRYLVVIDYRVKVIIPQDEMWYEKGDIPYHVMRSMGGAKIDYVITDIDREGDFCIASRSQALRIRRHSFLKLTPRIGKRIKCDILAVGQWHLLCTVGGFDITLAARDVSYAAIPDLRERYHAGESKEALIRYYEPENMRLGISIKRAQPHPFFRHFCALGLQIGKNFYFSNMSIGIISGKEGGTTKLSVLIPKNNRRAEVRAICPKAFCGATEE